MSIFEFISGTIYIQSGIISLVAAYTLGLLIWRRHKESVLRRWTEVYSDKIVNGLVESWPVDKLVADLPVPRRFAIVQREALKNALQQHIQSISGQERIHLILCYCKMGLANLDRDLCYSFWWWNRLNGITNLSLLSLKTSSAVFWQLRQDTNDLVASAAIVALSSIPDPLNNRNLLKELRPSAMRTHNLLMQLGSNWTRVHGFEFVIDCLREETRLSVINAFVAAVAEVNSPDACQGLVNWLTQEERPQDASTLVWILRTLKHVSDPSYGAIAKIYFTHADSDVRAEALDLWLRVSEDVDVANILPLTMDESLPIQRVWQTYRDKKAA